jgi:hypothetical protein
MLMKKCNNCTSDIPMQRLVVLPNTTVCSSCSNVDKVSAIPIIHHKTGNEIQIVADKDVANEFSKLSSRVGFGTLRGLKAGKSGGTEHKVQTRNQTINTIYKDDPAALERVGAHAVYLFDLLGFNKAEQYVTDNVNTRYISKAQGAKILRSISLLMTNV